MKKDLNPDGEGPMDDAYRAAYLIAGYIAQTLTEAEKNELDDWLTESGDHMRLFAELTDEENIRKGLKERSLYDPEQAMKLLQQKIGKKKIQKTKKKIPVFALGIAACLVLLAGLMLFTPLFHKKEGVPPASFAGNDLPPGSNRATLTLSTGETILLDSARGAIFQQENLKVHNENGVIQYEGTSQETAYHLLTVPNGGQYQLVLADGSKVWLNAGSSIRFPNAFNGPERRIEMTGEAYFEIAHKASQPFHVQVGGLDVTVLGTRFNINAYQDEPSVSTTLLEGAVKISGGQEVVSIKPGDQALAAASGRGTIRITQPAEPADVIAWKNGLFEFKDQRIEAIMRQLARWYDMRVRYEGKTDHLFNASISRDVPVSKIFHLLELTDRVHFSIEDKTIIVKP